jgi:hypothetical protein
MFRKVILAIGAVLVIFLGWVSTRESKFHYERSGLIEASASKIFPYISNFKRGAEWSPYEKLDPNLKRTFSGTDGTVGSVLEFEGNVNAGSGKLEILKLIPDQLVDIKLTMTKPMYGENLVQYRLTPEGSGTRFTWSMSGDAGFMGKLFGVFIDCEKMVGDQFNQGIANLRQLVETKS